jgi:phosphopantothenoylcysteine synthetase/decarboxylase
MTTPDATRVLYVIACGAGAAREIGRLVAQARQRGWDVNLIATPAAVDFLDINALEAQTGHAVRSDYQRIEDERARSLPHADAIIVAPATYNTINKWLRASAITTPWASWPRRSGSGSALSYCRS